MDCTFSTNIFPKTFLPYMSSGSDNARDSNPPRGQRQQSQTRRPNLVEFIDSQDPNVRSAIQRHTAYHAAAQRRDARSRLLRRSSHTRYLEWGRRTGQDADVPTSSTSASSNASSVSISPVPSMSGRAGPSRTSSTPTDRESETSASQQMSISAFDGASSTTSPAISAEDSILQFCE